MPDRACGVVSVRSCQRHVSRRAGLGTGNGMTAGDALSQVQLQAGRAAHGPWFGFLARLGFVARGLVYGLIGLLAVDLAFGRGGASASQAGALQTVAHQPLGQWLLVAVAVGLGGYAAWRLMQAALGHGPEGGGENSLGHRLMALASGVMYLSFMLLAIRILTSPNHRAGQKPKAHTAAHDVLSLPGGQVLLAVAGCVLVAAGLYQGYKGLSRSFVKDAKTDQMSPITRRWYARIGVVGYCGRAAVFALVGGLVLHAALNHRAHQAKGLDGSLRTLAAQPYGAALLCAVAAALVAFGLYSLADARYRRV